MPEHTPAPTPSRAVYGFAMYLSFKMFFILYLIWAIVPEEWFKAIGITCLPQRYWAVAIPIFLLTALFLFAFIFYPQMGLFMTPNVDDLRSIRNSIGDKRRVNGLELAKTEIVGNSACSCVKKEKCYKDAYEKNCGDFKKRSIPVLRDLNIWDVSHHLYGKQSV